MATPLVIVVWSVFVAGPSRSPSIAFRDARDRPFRAAPSKLAVPGSSECGFDASGYLSGVALCRAHPARHTPLDACFRQTPGHSLRSRPEPHLAALGETARGTGWFPASDTLSLAPSGAREGASESV